MIYVLILLNNETLQQQQQMKLIRSIDDEYTKINNANRERKSLGNEMLKVLFEKKSLQPPTKQLRSLSDGLWLF